MVDKPNSTTGKGRATPTRKEAEAARKKQMKNAGTRKEQSKKQRVARDAARARAREAMRTGTDDRHLPPREAGPVRRFCRDYVDSRFNLAEVLLPALVVILFFSMFANQAWAGLATVIMWIAVILGTTIDEVFMVRGLKKELRARFEPDATRGAVAYSVLRTSQLRRFRMPKVQVKRGEKLKDRY